MRGKLDNNCFLELPSLISSTYRRWRCVLNLAPQGGVYDGLTCKAEIMDFNALIEDMRIASANLRKESNNRKGLSAVYCSKTCKVRHISDIVLTR